MLVDTSVRCVVLPDIVICAPAAFVTVIDQEVSVSTPRPVILRVSPDVEILIPEPEVIVAVWIAPILGDTDLVTPSTIDTLSILATAFTVNIISLVSIAFALCQERTLNLIVCAAVPGCTADASNLIVCPDNETFAPSVLAIELLDTALPSLSRSISALLYGLAGVNVTGTVTALEPAYKVLFSNPPNPVTAFLTKNETHS